MFNYNGAVCYMLIEMPLRLLHEHEVIPKTFMTAGPMH